MANIVYIATSLDGFIATTDGGVEWLNEIPNPEQSDYGWSDFISGIEAILMGRNTFEKVLTFGSWPYEKPVFCITNRLKKLPKDIVGKAEIVKGGINEVIDQLNQRGYINIYIDGGKVIQSFLAEDMIDEMIITKVPILLGKGIPLFGEQEKSLIFTHTKTEIYNNSLVKSHYTRER
ncbi:MAG: dihydrofolate reductase [Deltaproteobacteria bacterium]|nr:dihydrofolate reductase [Deltaproteobacteria bacterium]